MMDLIPCRCAQCAAGNEFMANTSIAMLCYVSDLTAHPPAVI